MLAGWERRASLDLYSREGLDMSMPIADDKVEKSDRSRVAVPFPIETLGQARGEDFATLLPWHVDAIWSQTARSGGEWLFCQIAAPQGSARLLPVPHHRNSSVVRDCFSLSRVLVWYWIFRITCVIVHNKGVLHPLGLICVRAKRSRHRASTVFQTFSEHGGCRQRDAHSPYRQFFPDAYPCSPDPHR